jgi:voltage-gated potassium channel
VADGERTRQIKRLSWIGLALLAVVVYGTLGYMALFGWSFFDALYMTVMTMTTVGFREVNPLSTGGQVFTLTVIVLGVGIALIGIALTAAVIAEGELGGSTRRRRMQRRIDDLDDHFIVCAYGRVGRAAVRELEAARLPFLVVDPKEELRERMDEDGFPYLIGEASLEPVLRQAGVDRARGMICAVDSDATNVFITLTARSLNPELFIVARSSERGSAERLERAGADRVVSPYVSSGRHMVRMAQDPSITDPFDLSGGVGRSIDVEERTISPGSALGGRALDEAPGTVLAIRRSTGQVEVTPPTELILTAGDVILLLRDRLDG